MIMYNMNRYTSIIDESLVITIPGQVCDLYKFNPGDKIRHKI